MPGFEITPREVVASVSIILVMLIFGVFIDGKLDDARIDQNEVYNKASKIESVDGFSYAMKTNVGLAFVSGVLAPSDVITDPEIDGKYISLKIVRERYTMHTRRVAHTRTVNGKTQTYYTTETYWRWDKIGEERKDVDEVIFNGVSFPRSKIPYKYDEYIDTIREGLSYTRYKYYGTPAKEYKGVIFTSLKDGTISDSSNFYVDKTIKEAYESCLQKDLSWLFWSLWVLLISICVFGFYYIDNRWLY